MVVMTTLPQFIRVTVSPTESVFASAPSISSLEEYHTSFSPTSAFCVCVCVWGGGEERGERMSGLGSHDILPIMSIFLDCYNSISPTPSLPPPTSLHSPSPSTPTLGCLATIFFSSVTPPIWRPTVSDLSRAV